MRVFILIDENNIVRCMASEECNLHKDKLYMRKFYIEGKGIVGDEYNIETDEWTARPENYPKSSEKEINESKIRQEIRRIAIENLIVAGGLPSTYI